MKNIVLAIVTLATAIISSAQTAPYPATFFRMPSDTMAPDIPMGALIVIEPITGKIARGDLISYASEKTKAQLIKRVVAVSGDHIESTSQGLKINGQIQPGFGRNASPDTSAILGLTEFPALGKTLTVEPDCFYLLSNSPQDMIDSRRLGTVCIQQVRGKAILWREVLKVEGWPKVFLSRIVANTASFLPREIDEGFLLVNLSIKGDRTMHSTIHLQTAADGTKQRAMIDQFSLGRKEAYCKGSFEPKVFGVSASYVVMSEAGQTLSEFGFSPADCL